MTEELAESFDPLTYSDCLLELLPRLDESENLLRIPLRTLSMEKRVKTGPINGRQAPTTPNDDSTIGQYIVGVNRSVSSREQEAKPHWYWRCTYRSDPRHLERCL